MYLFGNLKVFKVNLSLQLDLCADVLSKKKMQNEIVVPIYTLKLLSANQNAPSYHMISSFKISLLKHF